MTMTAQDDEVCVPIYIYVYIYSAYDNNNNNNKNIIYRYIYIHMIYARPVVRPVVLLLFYICTCIWIRVIVLYGLALLSITNVEKKKNQFRNK